MRIRIKQPGKGGGGLVGATAGGRGVWGDCPASGKPAGQRRGAQKPAKPLTHLGPSRLI